MLKELDVRDMSEQANDAVIELLHTKRPQWHLDRLYGAQKTLSVVLDILGNTTKGETSLDCWKRFLETGN